MEKRTVTKEYYALDIEDIEKTVSEHFGEEIKVSDMDVFVTDSIPMEVQLGSEEDLTSLSFEISVGDTGSVYSWDLWEDKGWDAFISEKYVFNFDTTLFNSYNRAEEHYD